MPTGVYERKPRQGPWAPCSLDGCHRRSRSWRQNLCEMHYYRRYLHDNVGEVYPALMYGPPRPKGRPRKWHEGTRALMAARHKPPRERFMDRVEYDPFGGCWLWSGAGTNSGFVYGVFAFDGKQMSAHRASIFLFTDIPIQGKIVCHKCDVPACVNPAHLFVGTQSDNIRDCVSKGRWTQGQKQKMEFAALREQVQPDKRRSMGPARRRRILERYGNKCAYPDCEETQGLELDHIICLALGGKDCDEQIEPLCRHHHAQKTRRDVKMIAKAKRIVRKDNPAERKPSRLQSRGFQNNLTKRFDGTVVPRKGK